ncbi:MAG: peptidoglycan D,D-transpeptidase FtsI family protein, partial [Streptosporangiaceae bacterium]
PGPRRAPGTLPPRPPVRVRARTMLRRSNPRHRLNAALIVFAVVLSLFAGRLIQMQGLQWSKYRTLAEQRWTSTISIPTLRGSITTSDGLTLAMTEQTSQIVADPQEMSTAEKGQVATALASPLGLSAATILGKLEHPSSPENEVLAQTASQATSQRIMKLGLPGIALGGFPTYARLYPNGNLASNLVGFTNENTSTGDLTGQAGLEQEYNSLLAGRDGSEEVETGVNGMPIAGTETGLKQPVAARSLRLTIQSSIQYDAEQACRQRVRQTKAKNCSIVVMQPGTGHILAMAQYPTFNPSQPISYNATRNIAVTNVFAPGSTLKPLTVAAALEKGGQTPMSTYTVPDQIVVHGFTFHDAEPHATARYTVAGILANSLNDGMVQLVQKVTPLQQYDYLRNFGLDSLSGLGLPGESPGLLARPGTKDYWNDEPYELSFGQGIGVTAIQMASVYATIANGGVRVQPSIVAGTTSAAGKFTPAPGAASRRVIQAGTARALMTVMAQVPKVDALQGEPWGILYGYPVASKTGTAQVADTRQCKHHTLCQYGSSYIGIAPAQDPKLVVAVNVQDPTANGYYGDEVAGPVFYNVMKFALQTMKIPPTKARPPYIRLMRP